MQRALVLEERASVGRGVVHEPHCGGVGVRVLSEDWGAAGMGH